MALELKKAASRCELLAKENEAKTAELDKALREAREARSESRAAREDIRQAREIAAGKPFLLQTKFGDPNYAQLNQVWSSPDEFLRLAEEFFRCGVVLPSARGVCNGEAFLVTIRHAKVPAIAERTGDPMGRAPQDIRFCHEGCCGPAVAD